MKRLLAGCMVGMMVLGTVSVSVAADKKKGEAAPAAQSQAAPALTGKVIETMDSGGYTYVQIENKGTKTWIAAPQMKVTKGKTMSFKPGMEMQNFESKTLKRKFDKIIFSDGIAQ